MDKKIIVYKTDNCPYCHMAEEFFKDNKIKFKSINVSKDIKAAREMLEKSQQMGVPVIDVNGKIIIGYDKKALRDALNLK